MDCNRRESIVSAMLTEPRNAAELSARRRAEEHLTSCEECRREVAELSAVAGFLDASPNQPDARRSALMKARIFAAIEAKGGARPWRLPAFGGALAAAAAALIFALHQPILLSAPPDESAGQWISFAYAPDDSYIDELAELDDGSAARLSAELSTTDEESAFELAESDLVDYYGEISEMDEEEIERLTEELGETEIEEFSDEG